MESFAPASLHLAARNIAARIGRPPAGAAEVICCAEKEPLGRALVTALTEADLKASLHPLAPGDPGIDALQAALRRLREGSGAVLLLAPSQAPALFDLLGRPDQGVKVPREHLYCDWVIHPEGLVRTYAVDAAEQEAFRTWLLAQLEGSREVRVTTALGTDLTVRPRHWNRSWGEVYTAPQEGVAEGVIVVDGSLYWGPPAAPFRLEIRAGRVANLAALDPGDGLQAQLHADLMCDEGAAVLAELGIGVNVGADPRAPLMEAEQARGTCHLGFGNNLPYGGQNRSAFHGDVGVLAPTIAVDGRVICRDGRYITG